MIEPADAAEQRRDRRVAWGLGAATLLTTLWAGLWHSAGDLTLLEASRHPAVWRSALGYAAALLGILLAHELGHWVTARKYGVRVSPPMLLPGIPPIGTFGAAIRMELDDMPAGHLLRVAVWGPIAGAAVALPVLGVGVWLSEVKPLPEDLADIMLLGEPLLLQGLIALMHGPIPPGSELFLHPVAFAGWTGCLLTALNLLPIGQLDGGHAMRALVGPLSDRIAWAMVGVLVVLGVLLYPGWLVLVALLVVFIGVRHPPVTLTASVERSEQFLAAVALALFVLTFVPAPVLPGG